MAQDATPSLTVTSSDIVGAVQRGVAELQVYLNQPIHLIDGPMCVAHLERMMGFISRIPAVPPQDAANSNQPDAKRKAS